MKKPSLVMLVLAVLGLAVAFCDSYALYNGQTLWCPPPINGCNEVAGSPVIVALQCASRFIGEKAIQRMISLTAP